MNTCLYGVISTDKRFVVPNRCIRIGERSAAARPRGTELRAQYSERPLLLTTPGAVNWITGGLSDAVDITSPSDPVWFIESKRGRALITSEIEAPRLAGDFDLDALGWELLTVAWFDGDAPLRAVTSFAGLSADWLLTDRPDLGLNVLDEIIAARMVLSEPERSDLRSLGALAAFALESALDEWQPGSSTDFDIAALVSANLERYGAHAVCLIVGGDDRLRNFRHPLAIGATLHEAVMAVVVARRGGLHVAATRTAVASASDPILERTAQLDTVHAEVLHATRPGSTWGDAVEALVKGYENIGEPGAWREHFQGGPIAFEQREFELAPGHNGSPFWDLDCHADTAVAWNPSLRGGAKIEETYLVSSGQPELLTTCGGWELTPTTNGPQHTQPKVVQSKGEHHD
jgi:Xaa-Pro dipeptidase